MVSKPTTRWPILDNAGRPGGRSTEDMSAEHVCCLCCFRRKGKSKKEEA